MPWRSSSTDITLYYERTSGFPISYVAGGSPNGDLNGDGFTGNDLLYIPHDATDPNEIRIGTGVNAAFVQNVAAAQAFNRFIDAQPCLAKQRGHIMKRDSCRSPAQDRLDVSIRQGIPQYGAPARRTARHLQLPQLLEQELGADQAADAQSHVPRSASA